MEGMLKGVHTQLKLDRPLVVIHGDCHIKFDEMISFKQRVQMTAVEIWKKTGWRFT